MKLRAIFSVILVFSCLTTNCFAKELNEVGSVFQNLEELKVSQVELDYQWFGRFGENWPAKITSVETKYNKLSFLTQDGMRHTYPGFGYKFKLIRLISDNGKENAVVFRNKVFDKNVFIGLISVIGFIVLLKMFLKCRKSE